MSRSRPALRRAPLVLLAVAALLSACAHSPGGGASAPAPGTAEGFTNISYATWREDEPHYRIYPGDVLDVAAPSAPELNRTVTVEPDGRISLPLIAPMMAADLTVPQLEARLSQAYTGELVRPEIDVDVKAAVPLRIFVAGEVTKPGVYDMPGDIDALQAVAMAGGFTTLAQSNAVVIIRRGADGHPMMRTANLHRAIFAASETDAVPLRRFDVIYVPRTGVANAGLFVQQYIRDLVPVEFSYAITPNTYATVP